MLQCNSVKLVVSGTFKRDTGKMGVKYLKSDKISLNLN